MTDPIEKVEGLSSLVNSDDQGPYLIGGRCRDCEAVFFPIRMVCPRCTSQRINANMTLSRRGKLYTYTIIHHAPPDYTGVVPYVIGRVLLPEGVFVLAQLKADPDILEINMDMELVIDMIYSDPDGTHRVGYKFRPALTT